MHLNRFLYIIVHKNYKECLQKFNNNPWLFAHEKFFSFTSNKDTVGSNDNHHLSSKYLILRILQAALSWRLLLIIWEYLCCKLDIKYDLLASGFIIHLEWCFYWPLLCGMSVLICQERTHVSCVSCVSWGRHYVIHFSSETLFLVTSSSRSYWLWIFWTCVW